MSVHRGDEKADAVNIEQDKSDKSDDMERANPDYQPLDPGSAYEKALIKKIDWRLLPMIGALYSIALVDRVNLSNARVAGMGDDLQLQVGTRYTTVLVVFSITYCIFELPSNLVLRRVGAANWLSFLGFAWGSVMIGQGFVKSHYTLIVCRLLLGTFEAGFFPGCAYLVSCWYVRYEVATRLAAFYLCSVVAGGFANILAYGLMQMEGVGGQRGWQWIFIIEGLLTVVVAVIAWFVIVDFPDKAYQKGFLSRKDATYIAQRIDKDRGDAEPDDLTWKKFLKHLGDFKLWGFAYMFLSTTMPIYAFAYFTPTIIEGMGYSAGVANLLSAPPQLFAVPVAFFMAWVGDRYHLRSPVIAFNSTVCIIGLMVTAYHKRSGFRYFGLFLGAAGAQANIPAILAYQSNNIRTQSKRSVATALQIGMGALGGIVAAVSYRQQDAPKYFLGFWVTAGLQLAIVAVLGALTLYFRRKNKQMDDGTIIELEGHAGFKYTI